MVTVITTPLETESACLWPPNRCHRPERQCIAPRSGISHSIREWAPVESQEPWNQFFPCQKPEITKAQGVFGSTVFRFILAVSDISSIVLFYSVHSRSARKVSSTVGSSRPILGSLSMLSPSRLRGSIWRSSSNGNGVSVSTFRLTSGMTASAPLRSLKRLELESSARSRQQGRLGGVRAPGYSTTDGIPTHQPRQWSLCLNHFQAYSSALQFMCLPVGFPTPNFCRLSPSELLPIT